REAGAPDDRAACEQHDHGRAEIETADLLTTLDARRHALLPLPRRAARDLAKAERADARDVQRAYEHDDHRPDGGVEPAHRALVAAKEPIDRGRGRAAHAEAAARNVARARERGRKRRVHAVIV